MNPLKVGDKVYVDDGGRDGNYYGEGEIVGFDGDWPQVRLSYCGSEPFDWVYPPIRVHPLGWEPLSATWSWKCGAHDQAVLDETSKPTNPKDAIGSDKLPLHLWPLTASAMGCLGLLEGMLKYGRSNWRETGVRASIYVDALFRHVGAWFEGEDLDPDSGLPHLAHALACLAIVVDAQAAGKLNDDRQYPGGYRALVEELTPHVPAAKGKHADKDPKHWTIADA